MWKQKGLYTRIYKERYKSFYKGETHKMKTITKFNAKPFKTGNSYAVVIPMSKFSENILQCDKEYTFFVEVQ